MTIYPRNPEEPLRPAQDAVDRAVAHRVVHGAGFRVDRAGALRGGFAALVRALGMREVLVIPIATLFFAAGGVLFNMGEEIIAIIPVLVLVVTRLGFDPLVACGEQRSRADAPQQFGPNGIAQIGGPAALAQAKDRVSALEKTLGTLAVTSATLPLPQIHDLVDTRVAQKLAQIPGVGMVSLAGGQRDGLLQAQRHVVNAVGEKNEPVPRV
mgnify:CR=1 FL=1